MIYDNAKPEAIGGTLSYIHCTRITVDDSFRIARQFVVNDRMIPDSGIFVGLDHERFAVRG